MPDLTRMLTEAFPTVEPGFDAHDVRGRVRASGRRRRRVAVTTMSAVVVLLVLTVATIGSRTTRPADFADFVPLSQWPASVDFAGVEVSIEVLDEPTEPMESRVTVWRSTPEVRTADVLGTAALNIVPSDVLQPGNPTFQRVQPRLWFQCGTDQVVRMTENGPVDPATPNTMGRWLPPGALIEAAQQTIQRQGCVPSAPDGTPDEESNGQNNVWDLAAAIDRSGLASCCAKPSFDDILSSGSRVAEEGTGQWGVVLDGEPLQFSFDYESWVPSGIDPMAVQPLAGGQVVTTTRGGGLVAATCFNFTVVQAHLAPEDLGRFETFLEQVGCEPRVPLSLRPNAALAALMTDLGGEVVSSPLRVPSAGAEILFVGEPLTVTAGGIAQIDLPQGMDLAESNTVRSFPDGAFGAMAVCTIGYNITAQDQTGADLARDLADSIVNHPDCGLGAGLDPTTPYPDPDPEASE